MASAQAEAGGVVSYDTIEYTYDSRGNILSKTYLLNGETVHTITYGYTDSVWKDRLTSYNGTAISYDTIGNPLSWHDGSAMSWQRGRQLASYTKNGVTSTYTYNDDGMVIEKGEIPERGDHDDLLAQKGRYYKWYTGQFDLD